MKSRRKKRIALGKGGLEKNLPTRAIRGCLYIYEGVLDLTLTIKVFEVKYDKLFIFIYESERESERE